MDGSISFSGTLAGSIADGGGGGGSTVTITPTLESGTKIADFSIDSETGSIYAPSSETVIITPSIASGVKIADFTIGETSDSLYIPDINYVQEITQILESGTDIATYTDKQGTRHTLFAPTKTSVSYTVNPNISQDVEIGTLTIDGVETDVYIPSSGGGGGGISYSLTEQDTGLTWVDGSKIYQKTYAINSAVTVNNSYQNMSFIDNASSISVIIDAIFVMLNNDWYNFRPAMRTYRGNVQACYPQTFGIQSGSYLTMQYTKLTT